MAKTLQQKMGALSPARRRKIEAHGRALIAEEMALAELRQAKALTQKKMAETLGIGQEGVSRLEKRSDLLISTLREYVQAMGGQLRLIADFPDHASVELAGLAAIDAQRHKAAKKPVRPAR